MGQGALVAMTPDGAVLAMIGGRDYQDSQFNRAVQARRQPGSAFKPLVYLAALESGLGPDTLFDDRPIEIDGWRPRNFRDQHFGRVTMREGLARSLNSVAVQVSERAGRRRVVETAHRVGIVSELRPIPSLALGSNEVGIMELVSVYAAFANGGRGVLPHGIRDIRTVGGKSLYKRQGGGPGIVVAARPLVQLQEMMQAVIDEGSGQRADIGRPAAGKTGTTQDSRDAWFIGYTAQIVAGVWLGNDDGMAMTDVSGGGFAARIWRDFMLAAHADLPVLPLNRPQAGPEVASSGNGAVTIEVDVNRFVDRIWKVLGGGEPARQDRKDADYPNLNVN
jgi:penicillin-binding protein 1A